MSRSFYIAAHPVTQGQWKRLMDGQNPSWFSRGGKYADKVWAIPDAELDVFPVENVSWQDVQAFLKRLSQAEPPDTGWAYRLPTEDEWEYAARSPVPSGAAEAKAHCGYIFYTPRPTNSLSSLEANFDGGHPTGSAAKGPYLQRTSKVGSYPPNGLGLYDMHGNVWEWTQAAAGGQGAVRGGSWFHVGSFCAAVVPPGYMPDSSIHSFGLRLARAPV
jgi:formylglycine-generating enzyme required for sulfatase activity